MKNNNLIYQLSRIIEYPTTENREASEVVQVLLKDYPELYEVYRPYFEWFEQTELRKAQEIYTATFDLQGAYCLDIGYVLFGEDYKRGEFLVQMKRLQNQYLPDQGPELSDHFPYVMRLLAHLDQNFAKEMIEKILLPTLEKLLQGISDFSSASNYARILYIIKKVFETEYVIDRLVLKEALC